MAYPVSSTFRSSLIVSHEVESQVDVCSSDGTVLATLQPTNGNVTVDIDRVIRREAGDITVVDPTGVLTPDDIADVLSPLTGNELRLYRGIKYSSGSTELIPLGVFGFTQVTVSQDGSGLTITIGGLQDRAARVGRAKYVSPYSIPTATALETVIAGLLRRGWADTPGLGNLPTTGVTITSRSYGNDYDSDPWSDAFNLCDAKGYRLYFDVNGYAQMDPIGSMADVTELVRYTATATETATYNPMVTAISRTWDAENTYNGVIAVGEGSGLLLPFKATVWDEDPESATYYLGGFGKRPRVYSSPNIYSKAEATATASGQLRKTLGVTETVTWSQIPDPSLDVGDGVYVVEPDTRVDALYRIDRIDLGIGEGDVMNVTARAKRVTA